jgi:hypothetical protein
VDKIRILGITHKNNRRAIDNNENWTDKVEKIKQTIKTWSKRDLTILGKITVVKCFLVSQLIYVMKSIGLPTSVLTDINRIFYKFIWQRKFSNRKAFEKVKRQVMEGDRKDGGLNMVNVLKLQQAFYLQWIGKLETAIDLWTFIPKWLYSRISKDTDALKINCRSKQIKGLHRIKDGFWKTALCVHLDSKKLTQIDDTDKFNFTEQNLWNNHLVQYKKNILWLPKWRKNDIENVKDLIIDNRLAYLDELKAKAEQESDINLFDYNAVVNSLPKKWMGWIRRGTHPDRVETIQQSAAYSHLINKPKSIIKVTLQSERLNPICISFWGKKLGIVIHEWHWKLPWLCAKESRLRILQWKIIHHIFPTNIVLKRIGVTETDRCTYCPHETDYLEHFFFSCIKAQIVWSKVEEIIMSVIEREIQLTVCDVLFGYNEPAVNADTLKINHIILVSKMCLSKFRYGDHANLLFLLDYELRLRNLA